MNAFRPFFLFSLILFITATASAQQKICLSVHGGPSTGRTKHNTWPSELSASIKIGGVIDGTSTGLIGGLSAAEASSWHKTEFDFKGYVTCRTNPNEFCILAGPGGAPLQSDDYMYETTDTGLRLDVRVAALNDTSGAGCPGSFGHPTLRLSSGQARLKTTPFGRFTSCENSNSH